MSWTLENIVSGVSSGVKTLEAWGLSDLRRELVNQDADTVTLIAGTVAADAAEIFPRGSTVIIRNGDTRWFYGRVETWARAMSGRSEAQTAKIVGPWWYLAKKPLRQSFKSFDHFATPTTPEYVTKWTNRIFLNLEVDQYLTPTGFLQPVSTQLRQILQYAIDAGAPFQIGTIEGADIYPAVDEVKNITCAEAVTKQWRWARDGMFWFDYTTEPVPTVHFRRAESLAAVAVDLNAGGAGNAGELLESLQLEERVPPPYVHIQFEQTNNGYLYITEDFWPNPLPAEQFGGVELVIDLQGETSSRNKVTLSCEPIAVASKNWWKEKLKWLADPNVTSFTFVDQDGKPATPTLAGSDGSPWNSAYVRELLPGGGSLPDWIDGVGAQSVVAQGWVSVVQKNFSTPNRVPIHYELTATNANSGTYSNLEVSQVADPIPLGLARQVYEANARLAATGSLINVAAELLGNLGIGKVLNLLTPAQPGWASLRAVVQSVSETVGDGKTSIQFGPPQALSANDLVDLLRVARNRQRNNALSMRAGKPRNNAVSLGKSTPTKNSQSGLPAYEKFATTQTTSDGQMGSAGLDAGDPSLRLTRLNSDGTQANNPDGHPIASVAIRLSDLPKDPTTKTEPQVKLQPIHALVNGQPKIVYVLASDIFSLPSGGGGGYERWDPTKAYPKGSIVRVAFGDNAGVYGAYTDAPVGFAPTLLNSPYWDLLALGVQATTICIGGSEGVIYINASKPPATP